MRKRRIVAYASTYSANARAAIPFGEPTWSGRNGESVPRHGRLLEPHSRGKDDSRRTLREPKRYGKVPSGIACDREPCASECGDSPRFWSRREPARIPGDGAVGRDYAARGVPSEDTIDSGANAGPV